VRVEVDEATCQHHGQCMIECPEVFQLIGADELRYVAEPDDALRADVEAAADACPTRSITVSD
jgi:ferredoxin